MQSHTSLPKLLPMIAAWLVAFPTITALLVLLAPVIADWPLLARTFVLTLLMVPVISIATPAVLQLVRRVFHPAANATIRCTARIECAGRSTSAP